MVRFIIEIINIILITMRLIYIPIWLDLLYAAQIRAIDMEKAFTFQYG